MSATLQRVAGHNGLPMLVANAADGARAEIYLHGGHVTSWRVPNGEEQLFLSERSEFGGDKAIRGGVPIIFPQFDREGPLPRHGFARTSEWQVVPDADGRARLRLIDTSVTRAIWRQEFRAELTVDVGGDTLSLVLTVLNTGTTACSFTAALHTYLRVEDIEPVAVEGLDGVKFRDKVAGGVIHSQTGDVRIESETDRVYMGAPDRVVVREPRRMRTVEKIGFPDVVMWNPWDKGATLSDLETDGFRRMLCVEAAAVSVPVQLAPGAQWRAEQRLTRA